MGMRREVRHSWCQGEELGFDGPGMVWRGQERAGIGEVAREESAKGSTALAWHSAWGACFTCSWSKGGAFTSRIRAASAGQQCLLSLVLILRCCPVWTVSSFSEEELLRLGPELTLRRAWAVRFSLG